ncbi:DUF3800 domain-containing protein [Gordonia sihwensis]|uniref:DUF3800 domain-containing protein n=1 Tax=Gordonia sihwensis TaxID=173559 RepID=UPI002415C83E|nr:DUF3800 domain-containing protein [Gordonia sihwensis]WFN91515.1 DUF3800 domain-containing protein [Gordonia sihwensis]WFN91573.1 DUF3800 domain-containing protein [Gordonia sihwensis]
MSRDVYVYVDETGDRGTSGSASPIFGMAAVIVDEDGAKLLQAVVQKLRVAFKVPDGEVLSWKRYVKNHDRRKYAAQLLSKLNGVHVCYVWAHKDELREGSYRDDGKRFYNWVAYRTYKAAIWTAKYEYGADARVHFRFGHVKGFDHGPGKAYIEKESQADPKVPDHMQESLRWVSADRYAESQAADLYGGFLSAAIWPQGSFGMTESMYLKMAWPAIRKGPNGCAIPLGLFAMPDYSLATESDWFPCGECPKKARRIA